MVSIYIHIPFCSSICSYCDFCKFLFNKKWVDSYLLALDSEIKARYKGETVNTLYIGGGTPSILSLNQLDALFSTLKQFKLAEDYEFTFECNVESLDEEKLKYLYNNGVNRLSIGIQTFNEKYLELLNRHHTKDEVITKIEMIKKIGFKNINIDLIYALPNETLKEVENDIDNFLMLDITHISTYSLMIEPHTKLYIDNVKNIDDELDFKMYELICRKLKENVFEHYEISNFSKKNCVSKHNLVYWNNLEYYGFGVGSSGYIDGIRYDNTRNITKYLNGEWLDSSHKLSLNEQIENEFILGFRKLKGIDIKNFFNKYHYSVLEFPIIKKLISEQKLSVIGDNLFINTKYIYIQNEILVDFIGENYEEQMSTTNI